MTDDFYHIHMYFGLTDDVRKHSSYFLDTSGLEKTIELVNRLKSGQAYLEETSPSVDVLMRERAFESYPESRYVVMLFGEKDALHDALYSFLEKTGMPSHISYKKNTRDIVEKVLSEYGKTTKWKFKGGALGRTIVDK